MAAPKRFGLVIPKRQAAPAAKVAAPLRQSVFGDDDADAGAGDDVHGAIRRAQGVRAAQAEAAAAAASADAAAYDYDSWKETVDAAAEQEREARRLAAARGAPREARYISSLLAKAAERKRERDVVFDRMQAKELAAEDAAAGTSEKFVTPAYQAVLAERAAAEAEEARRAALEVHAGSAGTMNDFYLNLMTRNVSYGGGAAAAPAPPPPPAPPAAAAAAGAKRGRDALEEQQVPVVRAAAAAAAGAPPSLAAAVSAAPRLSPVAATLNARTGEAGGDAPPPAAAVATAPASSASSAAPPARATLSQDAIAAARAAALARAEARKAAAASGAGAET